MVFFVLLVLTSSSSCCCWLSPSVSKYLLSTGLTRRCSTAATLTRPARLYSVVWYSRGVGSTVPCHY